MDAVLFEDGGGEVCEEWRGGAGEVGPVTLPERVGAAGQGEDEVSLGQDVEGGAAGEGSGL